MGRLSGFKYRDVEKSFGRLGFAFDREAGGSHEIWLHADERLVTLVRHVGNYPEGLLRAHLRDAGITTDEFLNAR